MYATKKMFLLQKSESRIVIIIITLFFGVTGYQTAPLAPLTVHLKFCTFKYSLHQLVYMLFFVACEFAWFFKHSISSPLRRRPLYVALYNPLPPPAPPDSQTPDHTQAVCLMQLAAGERVYVVDMLYVCRPKSRLVAAGGMEDVSPGLTESEACLEEALGSVLGSARVVKVGVGPKVGGKQSIGHGRRGGRSKGFCGKISNVRQAFTNWYGTQAECFQSVLFYYYCIIVFVSSSVALLLYDICS